MDKRDNIKTVLRTEKTKGGLNVKVTGSTSTFSDGDKMITTLLSNSNRLPKGKKIKTLWS